MKAVRDVLSQKDATVTEIRDRTDALTKALHAIAQKLYQSGTPPPSGNAEAPPPDGSSEAPPSGNSGPVDADFKVVDPGTGSEKGQP